MAIRTASVSGNWSNTATWGGAAVPVNGDTVVINNGITVTFDVNQSGFANGLLSLAINGTLNVSPSAVTCLKMNGNITGTGTFNMGTSTNPIQRAVVGSDSRFNLILNATATIENTLNSISAYGWTPTKENSTLSANAALNATSIVLSDNLGLQQGDIIVIGCGNIIGNLFSETHRGVYIVQSYVSATKTVTLTYGLQTARLSGDEVYIYSRPIKISRTSTLASLLPDFANVNFTGVCIKTQLLDIYNNNYCENNSFAHCTFDTGYNNNSNYNTILTVFTNCLFMSTAADNSSQLTLLNCYSFAPDLLFTVGNSIIDGLRTQNIDDIFIDSNSYTNILKNSIIKNSYCMLFGGGIFLNNQTINSAECLDGSTLIGTTYEFKAVNCVFNNTYDNNFFAGGYGKLYNCVLNASGTIIKPLTVDTLPYHTVQSFDHNQIIGNYMAWMMGGSIVTQTISSVPQPGKLTFNPVSSTIPVFRDFMILAPANRTIKFLIGLTKDTSGILTKLQIIDPANDPLIDSTASPLQEVTAANNTNPQQLGIAYKSSTAKQLILRVLCQNSTGNVLIDVTRIQQAMQKPKSLI